MHLFLYSATILSARLLVSAQPVIRTDTATNGTLVAARWINGAPAEQLTATASTCTSDDDVLQCASKISQSWKIAPSAPAASRTVRVPCQINDPQNGHVGGCYFDATIGVDYHTCSLSDPVIVHKDSVQFCNDASCQESFTFQHSETDTHTYTYDLKTSVKAGVNFDFFTAEVGLEAGWSNAWSESSTNTTTVQRTYTMNRGDLCAPTTIQFNVNCDVTISGMTPPNQIWPNTIYDGFGNSLGTYWVCNDYRITGVDQICAAKQNPTIPVSVDLGSGAADGGAWSIDGCMFS